MSNLVEVKVPDIGDFKDVEIIEVLVKPGDTVQSEASLLVLESDKATMEIPSPSTGTVKEIKVKVGDKVSQGTTIMMLEAAVAEQQAKAAAQVAIEKAAVAAVPAASKEAPAAPAPAFDPTRTLLAAPPTAALEPAPSSEGRPHASPSVRKFARELGVDLSGITGSANKGRITKEDVQNFVKQAIAGGSAAASRGMATGVNFAPNLPDLPNVDFGKFGPIETKPLSRIKKISGPALHRNWLAIPHITQFDEADMTELEAFRKAQGADAEKQGVKLTPLAFIIKAAIAALKKFPEFNSSLDRSGENLILKNYYHIGFAADTPNGLVVPVIKNADQKGVLALAKELGELSAIAREGKLKPTDMQGGTFSISSLGGIGGANFTPIINAPEVAILGVGRSGIKPVWNADKQIFIPRLIVPLSLSYDHRVVDGALGARFITFLNGALSDIRRLVL
ncbi:MAG: dihydrolipoyllysine-residue acetyltransferase [Burkholderiales bacterium]